MTDTALPSSPAAVRASEARIASSAQYSNELPGLISVCETGDGERGGAVALAALQACRALFQRWAEGGELKLQVATDDDAPSPSTGGDVSAGDALAAYRAWLLRAYHRFVAALRCLVAAGTAPVALRMTALDSLVVLATLEAGQTRGGRVFPAALDSASGAYRHALNALAFSKRRLPEELLGRFQEAHLGHLDAAFYLLRHVRRLAELQPPQDTPKPERLLELLRLVTPPSVDVDPKDASLVTAPRPGQTHGSTGSKKRKRMDQEQMAAVASWPVEAKKLLERRPHRSQFCKAWRAVLALPLPAATYRDVLRHLPEAILPHVPRPLVYCDLLSDGYARGGVEAILALRGLFVLMTQYNLEYPRFYQRLYNLLTPDALCGADRSTFAQELKRFLSSTGLPAYLLAAFAKRLGRLALHATPSGAALSCGLIFNLMLQHPAARVLVHRSTAMLPGHEEDEGASEGEEGEEGEEDGQTAAANGTDASGDVLDVAPEGVLAGDAKGESLLTAAAAADPYAHQEEDPEACGALDSCLWEIDQLRKHVCPTVASLAGLFASPMNPMSTPPIDLEPLATLTYASLGELETRKKLRSVPLATRPPKGLFGADPADGTLLGSTGGSLTAGLGSWC